MACCEGLGRRVVLGLSDDEEDSKREVKVSGAGDIEEMWEERSKVPCWVGGVLV